MKARRIILTALLLGATLGAQSWAGSDCSNCGVVESVKSVTEKGKGSGLGLVAGGVVGGVLGNQVGGGSGKTLATVAGAAGGAYAGHEIEKSAREDKVWKVQVNMDQGKSRSFKFKDKPDLATGDRVSIEHDKPVRYKK